MVSSVYFAVRLCVDHDVFNHYDQFLWPDDGWKGDLEFHTDCLVFTLFHGKNRISSHDSVNHWIPFTEEEVDAKRCFKSHFMSDFLSGKVEEKVVVQGDFFVEAVGKKPFVLSAEAQKVMDAGRELWRYYHAQPNANPNASFYDIRLHFQGSTTDVKGKVRMSNESSDKKYTALINDLRKAMKALARRIEPKVYMFGFLKG